MTILFFARSFYPKIGGVEKHVLELSKRLIKKGYKIIVITEQDSLNSEVSYQSSGVSDKVEGVQVIRISTGTENKLKKFRVWIKLLRYISLIKSVDIVHCHDIFYWYLPYRVVFPFKKVYTTFHGYEGNNIPKRKEILMHKLAEKMSSGNICVGDFLKKWYGTKPTIVTYGAVDLQKIERYKKHAKIKPKNKIIFFGRLEEETGVMKYVHAFKALQSENKDLRLDIYGEGSLKEKVQKYTLDNNLHISVKNFIPNIESVLDNYEYIFCSRYLGILEGLAFKKPIFAEYNNLIMKDYLKMAPFSDFISISEAENDISNSVGNYSLNKYNWKIERGHEWVRTQSWDNMVKLYLKLWGQSKLNT